MVSIENLIIEIERLTFVHTNQEKLMQILNEKDNDLKEEIIILKTKLQEAKIIEDVMVN